MSLLKRLFICYYSSITIIKFYLILGKFYKKVRVIGGNIDLTINGKLILPNNERITFVNNSRQSTLGVPTPCKLYVYKDAKLIFHGQFGMSNAVIVATKRVEIGKNVMIGGGVTIVDSDFHSSNYNDWFTERDEKNMPSKDVVIGDNVFIGMYSIILKGVSIGDGAVIAAGSVVSKDIPANEVWGGNPAVFIKSR